MSNISSKAPATVVLLASLGVLASAWFLFNADSTRLEEIQQKRPRANNRTKPDNIDIKPFQDTVSALEKPSRWSPKSGTEFKNSLFVSERYIIENNEPKKPNEGNRNAHSKTGQPIPNKWFTENKLDPFKPKIATDDTDNDGFSNEDEFIEGTNPTSATSHPPYFKKLTVKSVVKRNNFVRFIKFTGPKDQPDRVEVTLEVLGENPAATPNRPRHTLKVGQPVPNSNLVVTGFSVQQEERGLNNVKVEVGTVEISEKTEGKPSRKFTAKEGLGRKGSTEDLVNFYEISASLFMPIPKPGKEIPVQIGKSFSTDPEEKEVFSVKEIRDNPKSVKIVTPDGAELDVLEGGSEATPAAAQPNPNPPAPQPPN
jgi:hypothetical protein